MVGEHERSERHGQKYERVMFTRLEFEWLADHPPLAMLDPRRDAARDHLPPPLATHL